MVRSTAAARFRSRPTPRARCSRPPCCASRWWSQVSDRVLVALEGGVLTATLNRPEKKNAIDTPMIDALLTLLERADLDGAVRVLAVRGAGGDFCAGMDLNELLASADKSVEENRRAAPHFADIFLRMRPIPQPTLSGLHGRALAA